MKMKKTYKYKKSQSAVEYLIIFAVIGAVTLIGLGKYWPQVKERSKAVYRQSAGGLNVQIKE